jgi:hypothetical protein
MVGRRPSPEIGSTKNSNFLQPAEPEAPLFDVCTGVCDSPPKAEESALVRALTYFDGVLG